MKDLKKGLKKSLISVLISFLIVEAGFIITSLISRYYQGASEDRKQWLDSVIGIKEYMLCAALAGVIVFCLLKALKLTKSFRYGLLSFAVMVFVVYFHGGYLRSGAIKVFAFILAFISVFAIDTVFISKRKCDETDVKLAKTVFYSTIYVVASWFATVCVFIVDRATHVINILSYSYEALFGFIFLMVVLFGIVFSLVTIRVLNKSGLFDRFYFGVVFIVYAVMFNYLSYYVLCEIYERLHWIDPIFTIYDINWISATIMTFIFAIVYIISLIVHTNRKRV